MSAEENHNQAPHERLAQLADQLHEPVSGAAESKPSTGNAGTAAVAAPAVAASTTTADVHATTAGSADPQSAAEPPPARSNTREAGFRTALIIYFPMAVAIMSLGMSIYQGYLFHRSIDLMERNVARGEYARACRDIIETYFLVKQKVGVLMPAADRGNIVGASRVTENNRLEAQAAIAKFGGLGTYLANFQDAGTRARYTELTRTLTSIMEAARDRPLPEIDKLFEPADKLFTSMNDDCVRLAREMRM